MAAASTTPIYYRSCDGRDLYKVDATSTVKAQSGGLDLSAVPPGKAFKWNAEKKKWEASSLPEVGSGPGCVRHTKNTAKVGV